MGAGVDGHLHDIGDESFIFPPDNGPELEIILVGSKRR
jgi:hypothetical protein